MHILNQFPWRALIACCICVIYIHVEYGNRDVIAAIKSNDNNLDLDANNDGTAELTLSVNGVGVGVVPSSNLHVGGNAVVSERLGISQPSPQHTLDIQGTFGIVPEMVSGNQSLSANSMVLVNTSGGDIQVSLPSVSANSGRIYTIKKISESNTLTVNGFMDGSEGYDLTTSENALPQIKVVSGGNKEWYILSVSGNVTANNIISSANLIGHWKLDEMSGNTAADSSGNNNTGSLTDGTSFSTNGVAGLIDNALNFNGDLDWVELDHAIPNGTGPYTISMWIKPNEDMFGANADWGKGLLSDYSSAAEGDFFLVLDGKGQVHFYNWRQAGTDADGRVITGGVITPGYWQHVVCVWDGSVNKIYIDGLSRSFHTDTTSSGWGAAKIRIGHFYNSTYGHEGAIDDVRVYDFALGESQVSGIYQARVGDYSPTTPSDNLIAHWKFDETSGNTMSGSTSLAHRGTHQSFPAASIGVAGKKGNAALFNGTDNNYITTALDDGSVHSGNLSISVWVFPDDGLASGQGTYGRGIMQNIRGDKTGDWILGVMPAGNIVFYHWMQNGNDADGRLMTNGVIGSGNWHHIAVTWDGSNHKVYIDNTDTTFDNSATSSGWYKGTIIGKNFNGGAYTWSGNIDELRIYDKPLTSGEVNTIYND